ncbi:hypothetical protein E3N88_11881 [Mikania micrantha]|uniref:Uncharacterized protein n=1 Tax=Mikania micrantha TaxID=192012 RepID=A0A5N6P489_9ASTR|nr:hypothetical protein E3N88_11881 [Mikania micrantha]
MMFAVIEGMCHHGRWGYGIRQGWLGAEETAEERCLSGIRVAAQNACISFVVCRGDGGGDVPKETEAVG